MSISASGLTHTIQKSYPNVRLVSVCDELVDGEIFLKETDMYEYHIQVGVDYVCVVQVDKVGHTLKWLGGGMITNMSALMKTVKDVMEGR